MIEEASRIREYVKKYDVKTVGGHLILYKQVSEEYAPGKDTTKVDVYKPGTQVTEDNYSTDKSHDCGEGLHVAAWDWLVTYWGVDRYERCVEVAVHPNDIVCIPNICIEHTNYISKIRCRRLLVLREIPQEQCQKKSPQPTPLKRYTF